jgi:hypothetical protein
MKYNREEAITIVNSARINHKIPNLCRADLSHVDMSELNLSSAAFRNANLSGSNFQGSVLFNADLTGAILTGINLKLADLTGARGDFAVGCFGRDYAIAAGGYISIGCERHTYQEWLDNGVDIGRTHGYPVDVISRYMNWIKSVDYLFIEQKEIK